MHNLSALLLVTGIIALVTADVERGLLELSATVRELSTQVGEQRSTIDELKEKDKVQGATIKKLIRSLEVVLHNEEAKDFTEVVAQNLTIEERVAVLEGQVTDLYGNVAILFENDNFLFDDQVNQDNRLLNLEQNSDEMEDGIEDLEDTALQLDFRVTETEQNGAELTERVETLEGTAAEHDTDITNLGNITSDHEARLTSSEQNIEATRTSASLTLGHCDITGNTCEAIPATLLIRTIFIVDQKGLLASDIVFDERITDLEEGSGQIQNNTIAFHAVLTDYDEIPLDSTVLYNEVFLNNGDGYNSATGVFTVPSFGDGFYYFFAGFETQFSEVAGFHIRVNGVTVCSTEGHNNSGLLDRQHASCSAVAYLVEGDEVEVIYDYGDDTTPVHDSIAYMWNVFNGFRI